MTDGYTTRAALLRVSYKVIDFDINIGHIAFTMEYGSNVYHFNSTKSLLKKQGIHHTVEHLKH